MSKNTKSPKRPPNTALYEYRVWGKHRKAVKKLAEMATLEIKEQFDDCYLLGDDPDWNAKVRNDTLKLKERGKTKKGFEQWDSNWHRDVEGTPSPFDVVFEDLSLDRPQRGKRYDLTKAVRNLDDDDVNAVFVTKRRRRFEIGDIRAESTKIDVHRSDTRMHTVAVQGGDVKALVKLLRKLGLDGLSNVPMHIAIAEEVASN